MPRLPRIPIVFAGFSSVYGGAKLLFDARLKPEQRIWSSASENPQIIYFLFDGEYVVEEMDGDQLSTDNTDDQFVWDTHLYGPNGDKVEDAVAYDKGRNVGRDQYGYSYDNDPQRWPIRPGFELTRNSIPRLDVTLAEPVRAIGGYIYMKGHGWFRNVNIGFRGRRRKAANPKILLEARKRIQAEVGLENCWEA